MRNRNVDMAQDIKVAFLRQSPMTPGSQIDVAVRLAPTKL